jgi:hypothetical protein
MTRRARGRTRLTTTALYARNRAVAKVDDLDREHSLDDEPPLQLLGHHLQRAAAQNA